MSAFTTAELEYLASQRLGRLATVGPHGAPHVMPVAFPTKGFIRITATRILTHGLDGGSDPMTARDVNQASTTETPS